MIARTTMPGTRAWWIAFSISGSLAALFFVAIAWLFYRGVGIWGINVPVAWAFAITNFVWWIGIGHAGTFISAILYLCKQEWRTAISRLAETMTIFAVMCAGLFPVLHLGRPWFAYWLFPYWDSLGLWPQFRSPLIWDLFAVLTYLTISLLYWYLGLVPDWAFYRDRSKNIWTKRIYGILALGWRGSSEQWRQYRSAYLIFAGVAAPLVVAVHSIVGMDFAGAITPGWHSTIFPPYFVAGAIFSGFAMVLTLAIPIRKALAIESVLTARHLELCAMMELAMSVIVSYGYAIEALMNILSDDPVELTSLQQRFFGPYAVIAWVMIFCNCVVPQAFWFKAVRRRTRILFLLSLLINVGMWAERFIIVVASLNRDYLPSSWHIYAPTFWDWATLLGSMGFFATLYLLFLRVAPILAITELREAEATRHVRFE